MKSAHELLRAYKEYVGASEAPAVFNRWSFIACLSANLSRNVQANLGHVRIYPNLYVMLMGEPATRKSTAINIARKLLEFSGFNRFAATQATKAEFQKDLEASGELDLDSVSQLFICADEFNNFIGERNGQLISVIMELFDAKDSFDARNKNGKSSVISMPSVQLLGGNTHANFGAAFPPTIIHNGFLSRMLLIHGERTGKKLPWGSNPDTRLETDLREHLSAIRENVKGIIAYTPDAIRALECIYETWEPLDDQRFAHYAQRRHTQLVKLCLVLVCSSGAMVLHESDVVLANSILAAAEDDFGKALGQFGKSRYAEEASAIMDFLHHATEPVLSEVLFNLVQQNLDKFATFQELMGNLMAARKIRMEGNGYVAVEQRTRKMEYVDFSLLHNI